MLRVLDPLARKEQDIALAVKDLVMQLAEKNIRISLKKVQGKDPFLY